MDDEGFDRLVKTCADRSSRRWALKVGALVLMSSLTGGDARAAKKAKQPPDTKDIVFAGAADHGPKGRRHGVEAAAGGVPPLVAPWFSGSKANVPTWKVLWGYGEGGFHQGDQKYAFDLVPQSGDAGGRWFFAPVRGKVAQKFHYTPDGKVSTNPADPNDGRGWFLKLQVIDDQNTPTGYTVHLYHVMDVSVTVGQIIPLYTYLGNVWNKYNYGGERTNHLHLQVTDANGKSVAMTIAGRNYAAGSSWHGTLIRNNALYSNASWTGNVLIFERPTTKNLKGNGVGDNQTSSLRVNPGCRLTLYDNPNAGGPAQSYTDSKATLGSFDNKASSATLVCS